MSSLAVWHKANDEYLARALAWLRERLERLAVLNADADTADTETTDETAQTSMSTPRTKDKATVASKTAKREKTVALPPFIDTEQLDPSPALMLLADRFGLTMFEHNVLLLCAAMELDTRTAALCARAQRDSTKPYPTFALALMLFDEPEWNVLSPERPLRYWRLIEINQPGAQPLTTSALRADERIVNYIKGLNYLDDRLTSILAPMLTPLAGIAGDLPPSQQQQVDTIIQYLQTTGHSLPIVHLLGIDSASKQLIAQQTAQALGLTVYRLPAEVLMSVGNELETLSRLYQRESHLLPIVLYLDAQDHEKDLPAISRFLSRMSGLVFLDTRESWPQLGREVLVLDIAKPTLAEQEQIWRQILDKQVDNKAGKAPALLAGQFNLNLPEIQRIAHAVLNAAPHTATPTPSNQTLSGNISADEPSTLDQLWHACLMAARPRLDTLAQRLNVKAHTWDDLVLPETEKNALQQIMNQVSQRHHVYEHWGFSRRMSRGLGINALFAGESGTGKTLAAEVIAHELKLNLYRIDLSQVVSKYIGETEKNLRKLFDAAEDGGTILFFDEADALFGKRSEVKDSHDRYANIEINYLLQRMEAYRGLAILATNMKSALDTAFMRRLRFIVNFPFPGVPERKHIWETAFPEETGKETLDYTRLAKFNLTGGSIHNIAINAAFLAASAGSVVTMPLIFEAVRSEFRKLDKPVNEAEFRLMQVAGAKT
ncbi:ATP-binding protein [Nitrosomonas sp.]|uniref:ATP-binding protein n=1 Tax=Nitrosomonas sp. TaxID=42353 RepID=UPI0037C68ACC